tara:strand:- start:54 stop:248 length:195 start_codon:yes stop_codon:yes gene_type:complete
MNIGDSATGNILVTLVVFDSIVLIMSCFSCVFFMDIRKQQRRRARARTIEEAEIPVANVVADYV